MTPETITHEDTRSSAEIQSQIRETRHRMDATLDELGNRFSARSIFTSALDWWDSGNQGSTVARSAVSTIYRQAKQHPMPALLIGGGIAWLVSESMGGDDRGETAAASRGRVPRKSTDFYEVGQEPGVIASSIAGIRDKASATAEKASDLGDKASEISHRVGEKIQRAGGQIGEQAHEAFDKSKTAALKLKEDIKEGYHTGTEKFEQACEQHPIAVGVAFAALGVLAGLVIPGTRRENELVGAQSDQLVGETKEKAESLLESGKNVGSRVMDAVRKEAGEQGLTDKLSGLANLGGQVFQKAKDEASHSAQDEGLMPATDGNPL